VTTISRRPWPVTLAGLVLLVVTVLVTVPAGSDRATAQGVPTPLPPASLAGRWETFANGDDVVALVAQDGVLWAGTRAGGLVRWETATGTYRQFLRPQQPLGANTIHDIAIDAAGRLWLATDGGLSVFADRGTADEADDFWFTYTVENSYGLPSDEIRGVAVDGRYVWVGGVQHRDVATGAWSGGGLGRLDTAGTEAVGDDTWAPVATFAGTYREDASGTSEPGLVSDTINDIAVTPQGNLWIATSEHWRKDQGADPSASPVWQRGHGGLSFVETKGTAVTTDDSWKGLSCELLELVVTCNVRKVAIDPRGRGWAADGGRGLIQFDPTRGQLVAGSDLHIVPPSGEGDSFVLDFAFGPVGDAALKNTVWMATRDGGLAVLDHGGTLATRSDDVWNFDTGAAFTTADGLAADRVQAVAFAGGVPWLGLGTVRGVGGGIQRFDPGDHTVAAPLLTLAAPPSNFVTDLAFGEPGTRWDGHVWVATGSRTGTAGGRLFGAGVADLNTAGTLARADDVWTRYRAKGTDDNGSLPWSGLAGDNVHAVAVRGDQVWFGSTETVWNQAAARFSDGGLAVFDGARWTARRTDNTGAPATGLGGGGVAALTAGCNGELWLGTGNHWDHVGSGVFALTTGPSVHDLAGDRWVRHKYPQLASSNTTGLAVDCTRRRLWVSSTHHVNTTDTGGPIGQWAGGGLAALDLGAGTWTRVGAATLADGSDGLETYDEGAIKAEAVAVAVGADGTTWAGTYGTRRTDTSNLVSTKPYWTAVLNTFAGGSWQNRQFPLAGMVSSVAQDATGRLWVATSRGGAVRETINPDNWPWDRDEGGLFVRTGADWARVDAARHGIPSNDLSVVKVAPDGSVWIASEGWGLARFAVGAPTPTPTPTVNMPTRTPTPTTNPDEPTSTPRPTTAQPTVPPPRPSPTTPRATATRDPHPKIYLSVVMRKRN
jgi:hypothetical protein